MMMMLSTGTASTSDCPIRVRYARKYTIDEKQRMHREVKQRKRLHLAAEKLQEERRRGEKHYCTKAWLGHTGTDGSGNSRSASNTRTQERWPTATT